MRERRGVLFDVDGTLVDSNDAHAEAWAAALAAEGHGVPVERIRGLIGKGGDKLLPELTGIDANSEEGRRIDAQRKRIFCEELRPGLRPFPGVRGLLDALRQRGFLLGVASSAQEDELAGLLRVAGASELRSRATSSDDARRSKPDPDIVAAALELIGLPAEVVTLIGDTPYDVAAARQAGVRCVALRCGGWSDEELAGAAAIFDDIADLHGQLDQVFPPPRRAER